MPCNTRAGSANQTKKKVKVTKAKVTKPAVTNVNTVVATEKSSEPTVYERLLNQVQENRQKRGQSDKMTKTPQKKKRPEENSFGNDADLNSQDGNVTATVFEDDNYVEMEVEGQLTEFQSQSEEGSDAEEGEVIELLMNNNATMTR